jgi:hypothetical protein
MGGCRLGLDAPDRGDRIRRLPRYTSNERERDSDLGRRGAGRVSADDATDTVIALYCVAALYPTPNTADL